MNPEKYIDLNKTSLINKIHQCSKNIDNKTHKIESIPYYQDLYKKLLTKYQSLLQDIKKNTLSKFNLAFYENELLLVIVLDDIGATILYFNYQKQDNSNSLFQLLYNLKKRKDNSRDIKTAQNKFKKITSPTFRNLTAYFQDIVTKNLDSRIYYRFYFNSNVTNYLSLKIVLGFY
ncbi:30491_t:CDS:2 [Gigaspora margarita]|uniref:30491_t:CDS:1 n=1 Tax=Gigaspora margarita TaxID=4874 RepID=A0ABN7UI92_GIGMA|nr:30491_t:CDS:2 [Gigaspora margarita]